MPRLRRKSKNQTFFLKTVNSLRSNRTVFLTEKTLIFLTTFSYAEENRFKQLWHQILITTNLIDLNLTVTKNTAIEIHIIKSNRSARINFQALLQTIKGSFQVLAIQDIRNPYLIPPKAGCRIKARSRGQHNSFIIIMEIT